MGVKIFLLGGGGRGCPAGLLAAGWWCSGGGVNLKWGWVGNYEMAKISHHKEDIWLSSITKPFIHSGSSQNMLSTQTRHKNVLLHSVWGSYPLREVKSTGCRIKPIVRPSNHIFRKDPKNDDPVSGVSCLYLSMAWVPIVGLIFMPPDRMIGGILFLSCLSVCLSVCCQL